MNAAVKPLYKNNRYRIIQIQSDYYLYDADKSLLGFVFFPLNWLIPQTAYAVDERTADDVVVQHVDAKRSGSALVILFLLLLFSLLISFFGSYNFSTLLVLIVVLIPSVIRFYLAYKDKRKLLKTVNYTELPAVKIKLIPSSRSDILKRVAFYFFFLAVALLALWLFIVLQGNWVISLCFIILMLLFLLTNNLAVVIGDYKVHLEKEI